MLFGVAVLIEAATLYLWFWLRRRFARNPYFYSHHLEFTNDGVRIVNKKWGLHFYTQVFGVE